MHHGQCLPLPLLLILWLVFELVAVVIVVIVVFGLPRRIEKWDEMAHVAAVVAMAFDVFGEALVSLHVGFVVALVVSAEAPVRI